MFKVVILKSQGGCFNGLRAKKKHDFRARLPYVAPGCSRFLGRSEHTCGMMGQAGEPTTSQHLLVSRCRLYH